MGYPDCGNGYYSDKLDYSVWYDFNCKQRAYKNMLEFLTPVVVFVLVGGLELPWVSIGFGLLFMVGRLLYAIGYAWGGRPKLRMPGMIMSNIGVVMLFIMSLHSIARIIIEMNAITAL